MLEYLLFGYCNIKNDDLQCTSMFIFIYNHSIQDISRQKTNTRDPVEGVCLLSRYILYTERRYHWTRECTSVSSDSDSKYASLIRTVAQYNTNRSAIIGLFHYNKRIASVWYPNPRYVFNDITQQIIRKLLE
jgi:hypothetical protein